MVKSRLKARPRQRLSIHNIVNFGLGFGGMQVNIPDLYVCEIDLGQGEPQVLIGRDIIFKGVFTTDFTNHFTFSI